LRTWRSLRLDLGLLGAIGVYAAFALIVTWPLVLQLGSSVYVYPTHSPSPGDIAGSVAHLRELVAAHEFPFLPGRIDTFNAPDGLAIRWPLNLSSFSSTSVLYLLALPFGANAAYGLFVLLGFVGSGVAMFLLVRSLTGSIWIGLITGWTFAFYPFAVVNGEHPQFIHGWVFVVLVWRMLELSKQPTPKNGLWAGAAGILAVSWTHYFILLAGVLYAALALADLALGAFLPRFRSRLGAHAAGAGLTFGFVLLMRELVNRSGAPGIEAASHELLYVIATAAEPLMYVVPPKDSLMGTWTAPFLAERQLDQVERTLYLGITLMLLGLIGLCAALVGALPGRMRRAAVFAVAAIVSGLVFSAPPELELFGNTYRTPTYLVYEATPAFRLYSRFVIVVMLGLCLLAALGLAALTRGQQRRVAAAILTAASIVVPLDLWDRPSDPVHELDTPSIYRTLRAQGPGIVAEYPLRPIPQIGHYLDLYFRDKHGHPILNGYFRGPDEERAMSLADLSDGSTAGKLATLGVRYVLLTPSSLVPGVPPPAKPGRGFRFVARDGYGSLYEVTASPEPLIYGRKGFAPLEGPPGAKLQWAGDAHAQLEVIARCKPCSGVLFFATASFQRPRRVEIRGPDGQTLRELTIGREPTGVAVPLSFEGRAVVDIFASPGPGPRSIGEVLGTSDPRKVTIWVGRTRFTPIR
jgi:hypothetical protein